jgi:hypothetical protein
MSHLHCWSLAWHSGMVFYWWDHGLGGHINTNNFEVGVKEFQMVIETATRFLEALQDVCIIDDGLPWHIDSSLCLLHCSYCDFIGLGIGPRQCIHRMYAPPLASCSLQNLTIVSLTIPISIPKLVQHFDILFCEWIATNLACHLIVRLINIPRCLIATLFLVIVVSILWKYVRPSRKDLQNCFANTRRNLLHSDTN